MSKEVVNRLVKKACQIASWLSLYNTIGFCIFMHFCVYLCIGFPIYKNISLSLYNTIGFVKCFTWNNLAIYLCHFPIYIFSLYYSYIWVIIYFPIYIDKYTLFRYIGCIFTIYIGNIFIFSIYMDISFLFLLSPGMGFVFPIYIYSLYFSIYVFFLYSNIYYLFLLYI